MHFKAIMVNMTHIILSMFIFNFSNQVSAADARLHAHLYTHYNSHTHYDVHTYKQSQNNGQLSDIILFTIIMIFIFSFEYYLISYFKPTNHTNKQQIYLKIYFNEFR